MADRADHVLSSAQTCTVLPLWRVPVRGSCWKSGGLFDALCSDCATKSLACFSHGTHRASRNVWIATHCGRSPDAVRAWRRFQGTKRIATAMQWNWTTFRSCYRCNFKVLCNGDAERIHDDSLGFQNCIATVHISFFFFYSIEWIVSLVMKWVCKRLSFQNSPTFVNNSAFVETLNAHARLPQGVRFIFFYSFLMAEILYTSFADSSTVFWGFRICLLINWAAHVHESSSFLMTMRYFSSEIYFRLLCNERLQMPGTVLIFNSRTGSMPISRKGGVC